jgi:hypothetical protein
LHQLSGDLACKGECLRIVAQLSGAYAVHLRENYVNNGVPWFNSDRSQTLASIERLKEIVATFKATLIIQHDIDKLPAFPTAAK